MLHFLDSRDKATYPDERQRVQQGFLVIFHASSGLRPSSVTQLHKGRRKIEADKTAGVLEEVVKLRYRDVALLVTAEALSAYLGPSALTSEDVLMRVP